MEILYMDTSIFEEETVFEKGMSLISMERKNKIRKYKNQMPARLSLGAGVLLRIALEEHGLGDQIGKIKIGVHGKPYLENTAFHFSLSHSGKYALCAISTLPIGADLQQIKVKLPQRTNRILTNGEKAYLARLTEEERIQTFYRLWARKESLLKWDGRGLRLPMEQFSFVQDDNLTDAILFEGNTLHFREYQELFQEYAVCLCNGTGIFPEKMRQITAGFLIKY